MQKTPTKSNIDFNIDLKCTFSFMHWHFRLVSSPNQDYLAALTTYLACSCSSFWLISSTCVEQGSVIPRFCENECLNNGEIELVLLSRGRLQHNLPACVVQLSGWPAYRDQPFSRKHLQYRLPLSRGETESLERN